MNIVKGEFRIDITIDSYEFPYHETNTYQDNNWLNVKAICEDDVLIDQGIEACLQSSELQELYQGLTNVLKQKPYHSAFLEPNLRVDVEWNGENIKFLIRFHRKNKDKFKVVTMYSIDEFKKIINEVKDMVDAFPIRKQVVS